MIRSDSHYARRSEAGSCLSLVSCLSIRLSSVCSSSSRTHIARACVPDLIYPFCAFTVLRARPRCRLCTSCVRVCVCVGSYKHNPITYLLYLALSLRSTRRKICHLSSWRTVLTDTFDCITSRVSNWWLASLTVRCPLSHEKVLFEWKTHAPNITKYLCDYLQFVVLMLAYSRLFRAIYALYLYFIWCILNV